MCQSLFAVFLREALGELRRRRGFARALQAQHQDRHRRRGAQIEFDGGRAQHFDELVVDDLDDHLARRDRAHDLLADRFELHAGDEVFDHLQGDVGLQQGHAHFAQCGIDIGFGERTAPAQLVEDRPQLG